MINVYTNITIYEGSDWKEYLEKICLYEIFKPLVEKYGDRPGLLKCLIRYIVWAYSKDSDKITLGTDWKENKKRIYDAAQLPPQEEVQEEVIGLKNETVLATIKKWLEFQQDETWNELVMLKDLRVEMQVSANSRILNAALEVNYDQKFKNAKYSMDLALLIRDTESKLLQNDPKLKEAIKDVRQATKVKTTIGPEMFSK